MAFRLANRDLALDSTQESAVQFYAHLFATRAAAALGRPSEVDAHAVAALALFPEAQSAILAASEAALGHGESNRAQLIFRKLDDQNDSSAKVEEPWVIYPYGPDRALEELLTQLRRATPSVR
jgi:hypothetical protein